MVKIQIFETNEENLFFFFFLDLHSRFIENCIIPISPESKCKKKCWKKKTPTQIHNQGHKHKQTTPPYLFPIPPHPLSGPRQHPVRTPTVCAFAMPQPPSAPCKTLRHACRIENSKSPVRTCDVFFLWVSKSSRCKGRRCEIDENGEYLQR